MIAKLAAPPTSTTGARVSQNTVQHFVRGILSTCVKLFDFLGDTYQGGRKFASTLAITILISPLSKIKKKEIVSFSSLFK